MGLKFAENKKKLHKILTVVLGLVLVFLSFLDIYKEEILKHLQILVPADHFSTISAVIGLAIIIGRYIKQIDLWTNKNDKKEE